MPRWPAIDRARRLRRGFTLVELLVSMAIVAVIVVMLGRMIGQATDTWNRGEGNKERMQNARAVADFIGNELTAALLPVNRTDPGNLQLVVNSPKISATFKNHDAIFWQAPLATEQTLGDVAEIGYFVQWDTTTAPANPRAQLCRFFVNPTTTATDSSGNVTSTALNPNFLIYSAQPDAWLTDAIITAVAPANKSSSYQGLFAENVIGLWTQCLAPNGAPIALDGTGKSLAAAAGPKFDSRLGYQYTDNSQGSAVTITKTACALPAAVDLSLVMLDSKAAARITPQHLTRINALYASADVVDGDTFVTRAVADTGLRGVSAGMHSYRIRIFLQNSK